MSTSELARRIDQGLGREPADLVVRNARILNTATGTVDEAGDVAVCHDTIVGTHGTYRGRREIEAGGRGAGAWADRHAPARRELAGPAGRVRGGRAGARDDDRDLRPA